MYTYKVVIHPNNKQRTKILNTMNKCIECQNIVFDILNAYINRKEKLPKCSEIRKLFTTIKKEKDTETINNRVGLNKKEQEEKQQEQALNFAPLKCYKRKRRRVCPDGHTLLFVSYPISRML